MIFICLGWNLDQSYSNLNIYINGSYRWENWKIRGDKCHKGRDKIEGENRKVYIPLLKLHPRDLWSSAFLQQLYLNYTISYKLQKD